MLGALETFLHFDGKFFRSLYDLLFKPGQLTVDFLAGRRASQVPPFRLYVFVSVLFFLWISLGGFLKFDPRVAPAHGAGLTSFEVKSGSSRGAHLQFEDTGDLAKNRQIEERLRDSVKSEQERLHLLPKLPLVCLPLFALGSHVLFRRARLNYLQNLLAALHLHAFFFVFLMTIDGWQHLVQLLSTKASPALGIVTLLYLLVYGYVALRRIYGESRWATLWKGTLLAVSYTAMLVLGIVLIAMVGVWPT